MSVKYDDICDKCAHGEYCDMATFGGHNPKITACYKFKEKNQTNADRIRAMTDEELAVWIRDQIIDRNIGVPSETWLEWLKQEANE